MIEFVKKGELKNKRRMTQEDRQLLLKDLCARFPYRVIVERTCISENNGYTSELTAYTLDIVLDDNWSVKPYLRPMSSMTKEEYEELKSVEPYYGLAPFEYIGDWGPNVEVLDWLNSHHFDYRNLIEKGLALEALEGMYKDKEEMTDSDEECQAFKDAKEKNLAYIIEGDWIVRVYADNHKEKIMKIDNKN